MNNISDRSLIILVISVLFISIFSTAISLQKIDGMLGVTGKASATGTGTVNLTVASSAYINLSDNWIDFGAVEVTWQNWSEQLHDLGDDDGDFFEVRNIGSVDINISIYDSDNDTGIFTSTDMAGCEGEADGAAEDSKCIFVRCNMTTDSTADCNTEFIQLGDGFSGNPGTIAGNISQYEYINISLNMTIPSNEPAGADKQGAMTILGIAAG